MFESTGKGIQYFQAQSETIERAIKSTIQRIKSVQSNLLTNEYRGSALQKQLSKYFQDREPTKDDFCVFIKENGYLLMLVAGYEKLPKTTKKKIERDYEFRYVPEELCPKLL